MVDLAHPEYMRAVARELHAESWLLPDWQRRAVQRRAAALVQCIGGVRGYECEECHKPAEASGELVGVGKAAGPCHARICPRCARRRSAQAAAWGARLEKLEVPEGWSFKFMTLTSRYDASNENGVSDLEVPGLRARWRGFRLAWGACWAYLQAKTAPEMRKHLGAICSVELAGHGNVHLHVLFLSPYVDHWKTTLLETARLGYYTPRGLIRGGWRALGPISKLEMVEASSVKEIAKYPIKTPGGAAESWLGGRRAFVKRGQNPEGLDPVELVPALVNPVLAARWEVALYGRRVHERYGSFRELPKVRVEESVSAASLPVSCSCGAVRPWRQISMSVFSWVALCHLNNMPALATPRAIERATAKREDHVRKPRDRNRWKCHEGGFVIPGARAAPGRPFRVDVGPIRERASAGAE
jgi:hypothetical protein